MISTASRVGTSNIAGIATALAAGGPGAIFWMWLMAVIGGASAFVESTLAQVYKVKDGESFRGGPSYYIEHALKKRWLGILFSVLLICCFAYGFNGLQSYNISSSLQYYAEANFLFIKNSPVLLNVFRVLDDYRAQKKAGKAPVFKAADLQIYDTDAWK